MKGRFSGWGSFLKKYRERRFRSAREFCSQASLDISYPQYSRYEAGDQLPDLDHAIALFRLLGVNVVEGMLEWARAQASDPQARGEIEAHLERHRSGTLGVATAPSVGAPAKRLSVAAGVSLDEVIVFNRSHLDLFQTDPAYRDLFTYVNAFQPEWIGVDEVSAALGVTLERAREMISKLVVLGVLLEETKDGVLKCRSSKRTFYFPDDRDFFEQRNQNFIHNVQGVLGRISHEDLSARRSYRAVATRELTEDQARTLAAKLDEAVAEMVRYPETPNPRAIYSLCLLMGERFVRSEREAVRPGLKRAGETLMNDRNREGLR